MWPDQQEEEIPDSELEIKKEKNDLRDWSRNYSGSSVVQASREILRLVKAIDIGGLAAQVQDLDPKQETFKMQQVDYGRSRVS